MSDLVAPRRLGDVGSLIIPPRDGSPTPSRNSEVMTRPGLVSNTPDISISPTPKPLDLLTGDNPNPITPLSANDDPAGLMETPRKQQDDINNRATRIERVYEEPQVQMPGSEQTPPKGVEPTW